MKEILYESEIFAENVNGVFPYKIIVEKEITDDAQTVSVIRKEFNAVDGKIVEKSQMLTSSFWKLK